jgi:hypothetical protein
VNSDELSGIELARAVFLRRGGYAEMLERGVMYLPPQARGDYVVAEHFERHLPVGAEVWHSGTGDMYLERDLPRPDQRIELAWELVGEIRSVFKRTFNLWIMEDYWYADAPASCRGGGVTARGNTPAEAICRAYLKATDPEVAR